MTDETTTAETTDEQATPGLSLQDLQGAVQVIDLCSQRGAFQGSELEAVGALRGRLQAFVAANTPDSEESNSKEEEPSE